MLKANTKKEDVNPTRSSRTGIVGLYETVLRKHHQLIHALTLIPVYATAALVMGISLFPAVALFAKVSDWTIHSSASFRWFLLGVSIASGFFIYGFCLIFVVPIVNLIVRPFVRPSRGSFYSANFVGWYLHNALTYLVRYTFLDFITPTPFNLAFFKLMGMKIAGRALINTGYISDPLLIFLEEGVTIGGSATLIAHYGMGGYLVVGTLVIRRGATIGLKATLMGNVEVGENATILPHSVVLPNTKVPAGETWGGIPAVKITQLN